MNSTYVALNARLENSQFADTSVYKYSKKSKLMYTIYVLATSFLRGRELGTLIEANEQSITLSFCGGHTFWHYRVEVSWVLVFPQQY